MGCSRCKRLSERFVEQDKWDDTILRDIPSEMSLVEKRRGLGMYVNAGARAQLLQSERERSIRDEWPPLRERLRRLGLDLKDIYDQTTSEVDSIKGSKN